MKVLPFLFVLLSALSAQARYCNSPYCSMCNRLFGPMDQPIVRVASSVAPVLAIPKIESTPMPVVDVMLDLLNLTAFDVLYDPGCGDARFLIRARQRFGCLGVGIEIDPVIARYAKQKVQEVGCGGIRIVTGDATKYDLSDADAVVMYLFPDTMRALLPRIRTRRIVSYQHAIPGIPCVQLGTTGGYVWSAVCGIKPSLIAFSMW